MRITSEFACRIRAESNAVPTRCVIVGTAGNKDNWISVEVHR